jgi:hypothetical protein
MICEEVGNEDVRWQHLASWFLKFRFLKSVRSVASFTKNKP